MSLDFSSISRTRALASATAARLRLFLLLVVAHGRGLLVAELLREREMPMPGGSRIPPLPGIDW